MYYGMPSFQYTKLFSKNIGVSLSWDNKHNLYFNALVIIQRDLHWDHLANYTGILFNVDCLQLI